MSVFLSNMNIRLEVLIRTEALKDPAPANMIPDSIFQFYCQVTHSNNRNVRIIRTKLFQQTNTEVSFSVCRAY